MYIAAENDQWLLARTLAALCQTSTQTRQRPATDPRRCPDPRCVITWNACQVLLESNACKPHPMNCCHHRVPWPITNPKSNAAPITSTGMPACSLLVAMRSVMDSSAYPVVGSCGRVNASPSISSSTISAVVRTMQPGITWPPTTLHVLSEIAMCRWCISPSTPPWMLPSGVPPTPIVPDKLTISCAPSNICTSAPPAGRNVVFPVLPCGWWQV